MSNNGSNTSNGGGPTSMSNASRGVNGVSAGDWVRLKRLQGARTSGYSYTTGFGTVNGLLTPTSPIFNKDVAPTTSLQVPYGLPIHVFPVGGSSKIRRPASNWTDHIAFKNADVVFSKQASSDNATTVLTRYRLCDCTKTNLADKDSVCRRCLTRRPQGEQQETTEPERPPIVIDWQFIDADSATEDPVCYVATVAGPSLPYIFAPCITTPFSFSFSNLINIQNVTTIVLTGIDDAAATYDFSSFTLSNVSIAGGGSVTGVIGTPLGLAISVTGLSSSSTLSISPPLGSRPLCTLADMCITAEIPPAPGPIPDILGVPTSGDAPLIVSFTGSASPGPILSWFWDFGDGGTSTLQNPNHTYTVPGTYTVSLTATNISGSGTVNAINYITVTAPPSGTNFTVNAWSTPIEPSPSVYQTTNSFTLLEGPDTTFNITVVAIPTFYPNTSTTLTNVTNIFITDLSVADSPVLTGLPGSPSYGVANASTGVLFTLTTPIPIATMEGQTFTLTTTTPITIDQFSLLFSA